MRDLWGYVRDHRRALGLALAVTLLVSVAQPLAAKAVVDALGLGRNTATPGKEPPGTRTGTGRPCLKQPRPIGVISCYQCACS